jgi:bacillithiol biosynthesis deacetylase BshB1
MMDTPTPKDTPLDLLAFSPHPDDAELGCGGSLILASDRGLRVAIADLSGGEKSSRGTPQEREGEKARAAELLGLCARFCVGLPDTEIGTDAVTQRVPIIRLLRETRPRVVLAPYWDDRHPDHTASGKLVREACYLAGLSGGGTTPPPHPPHPPHRPERLYFYMLHTPFAASFVVDVSSVWERRMAAVLAYHSQFQAAGGVQTAISRPAFLRFVEARALCFGALIGAEYGEAFTSLGAVPMSELPGLSGPAPPYGELPPYLVY